MARRVWTLEFRWFGGSRQTILLTATSALLMWLGSTERTGVASNILIFNQHVVLKLIVIEFQCLSSENFLTFVTKMPPVLKDMKTKKKRFLNIMLHIYFPKRRWMIKFASSASQRTLLNCWHPDLRKKPSSLTVLASASSATGIKSTSVFSLQLKTWCTVQILCKFCSSFECHSTNPMIGDCSSTAASDHWNVFYYPPATSLLLYASLTRLQWRRSMKGWSMCWRKLVMISISGLFVLTWRWTFCRDNILASPSNHVFCTCGIKGTVLSITRRKTGFCGRNWCLAKKGRSSTTL